MEVVGGEFDCNCSKVLVQTRQLSRARDRNDPWLLGEEPGERDLSRCRLHPSYDVAEQIDDLLVGLPGIGSKAWEPGPNVGGVERHRGINLPREEALP